MKLSQKVRHHCFSETQCIICADGMTALIPPQVFRQSSFAVTILRCAASYAQQYGVVCVVLFCTEGEWPKEISLPTTCNQRSLVQASSFIL